MTSEYCCGGRIHIHRAILLLAVGLLLLEFYIALTTAMDFVELKHHRSMRNMTVREFMNRSTEDISRSYAHFLLYGNGTLKAILEYSCRIMGIVVEVLLLLGNVIEKPKLYSLFIWYSGIGLLFIVAEVVHNITTAISVLLGRFVFVPMQIQRRVGIILLEYAFVDILTFPVWLYLVCLVIAGQKYLQSLVDHKPIAPTSFANNLYTPNASADENTEVGEQRV
ncbi:hypothetical protein M3Y98_01178100 [Aphelenchoides besseyi]|nr:hypothetical protein M3Y98_01178100 [Aphelenchoides besseyi]KAI6211041.1 hypothetical protein M3Y96_00391300 [Aphelenchoides besseyi]